MDEHAQAVAARWAKKRAETIAHGMTAAEFDNHMLAFMRWAGWNEENAQAICKRAKQLHEKEVSKCEQS